MCMQGFGGIKDESRPRTDHDTKHAVRHRHKRIPRSSLRRGEQFGGDRVKNAIHDVARKRVSAVPSEQGGGVPSSRGGEQEDTSQYCGERCG
jgi:hypothetical protein